MVTEQNSMAIAASGGMLATLGVIGDLAGWGAIVLVVSLFGWAVSSLDQLAGWTDDAPRLAKLTIVKGICASVAAAAIVVIIGHWLQWHPLANVVAAFLGGMAGDKLLRPMADGLIARIGAGAGALFGGNGADKGKGP